MYLKIRRSAMTPFRESLIVGFTFKVEVIEAVDVPEEIFVFLRIPQPGVEGESDDQFQNIASPTDLQEYPVEYYREFLNHIKTVYSDQYWLALPREVATFWCKRIQSIQTLPHL